MKRSYLGAVCESDGSYGIVFLDFPGCVSAGETLDDVLVMGGEALQGHVEAILGAGELLPAPTQHELSDVLVWLDEANDPSGDDWVGLYPVSVEVAATPHALSVPVEADILHEISKAMEVNLSILNPRQFIEQATRRELLRLKKTA